MTPISYMTPAGDFACSCQTVEDKPHEGLIEIPVERLNRGEMYGSKWDMVQGRWVDDPASQARADAFMDPVASLAQWRQNCLVAKWRLIAVLNMTAPEVWPAVEAYADSPECDPISRSAIKNATDIARSAQVIDLLAYRIGWDNTRMDELFKAAEAIPA